ncbi:Hypothetical predicted protein [Lecanosticta acicola]|uniref:DUF1776-domain-containing protein n=1 Tax=Lecanosticta acicola TaxID=111012 RepID=A0AAI9ED77_9PEZI|nr:Hypothetical predicted protein [Lecanosticta acicola]
MTDAQQLIDYARNQFNEIAADVERHFDLVAGNLRERFAKPLGVAPPPRRLPSPTTFQVVQRWIHRHKALTAAIVAFFVTGSLGTLVYVWGKDAKRKRRARKSASGARTDVVIIAGAVANPLTSALYLDLERRGFVVYVVANTAEDEYYIRSQSRADLLPLPLNMVDPFTAQQQRSQLQHYLAKEHHAFERAEPHRMRLAGLILVPDTQSAPAKVEDISSEEWSDALNAKVLNTIATTQLLLPIVIEHKARVLLLTPSMTPAIRPPTHAMESTVFGALQGFSTSLAAELKQEGVSVSHLKLGHIDVPANRHRRNGMPAPRLKPTPVRRLHDTVFDTLVTKRPRRTYYVGRGSFTYDVIGSILPPDFVAWMMGVGRKPAMAKQASEEDMHGSAGSLTWEKIDA